ncbi:MAG: hypothetical protein ACTSR8_08540 [Promethearchaeota archaeon]
MCNNCNCEMYDHCSIVGFMPIGFCCSKCILYDEFHTCLTTQSHPAKKVKSSTGKVVPISTTIEGGLLKVVVKQEGKEIPIFIDLQKHLNST